MPYRHAREGRWHRGETLACATLHRLAAKLVEFGGTKPNLAVRFGALGYAPIVRPMINELLSRADMELGTLVGKMSWIVSFLLTAGREDLLKALAPRIGGDECWTACVCMAEPSGGVNVEAPQRQVQTVRAEAREDGDHWVLDGRKR
jgi:alkylation response protein AidB-like acyl-CoA dehydrogenase